MIPHLQLAVTFPVYLRFGPYTIHPHLFFETLSYIVAFGTYLALRRRFGDALVTPLRWAAVAAAVAGALFGSKLLAWLEDPSLTWRNLSNPAYFVGGKTIVGALIGGLIMVEAVKNVIGLRISTGDLYAIPLALGIAIGRVGCFLTGLADNTYGMPTNLPWGINFGDGMTRHPTQFYEIAFLLALIPVLFGILQRIAISKNVILSEAVTKRSEVTAKSKDPYPRQPPIGRPVLLVPIPGDAFKFFMVAYMTFRLFCDFIKPYPRIFLGLGSIQWACVVVLLYYSRDIIRWLSPSSLRGAQRT